MNLTWGQALTLGLVTIEIFLESALGLNSWWPF